MNRDPEHTDWPEAAGDPRALPLSIPPPPALEDRVVATLLERGLVNRGEAVPRTRPGWRIMRVALATAACVALVAIGVIIGRLNPADSAAPLLTGAATDLYALLLYETDGYDRPAAAEAKSRYGEYSHWVGEANARGQFVAGEDLDVDDGWLIRPTTSGTEVDKATAIANDVALSGIFFIRARSPDHALELAESLPHLRHGGSVLVQKTIPTDKPPTATESFIDE